MSRAIKDNNNVNTITAVSNADGQTIVPICADPTTHILCGDDGDTGSDVGPDQAKNDDNSVPTLLAVSSDDGITPVAIYADPSTKEILIQST